MTIGKRFWRGLMVFVVGTLVFGSALAQVTTRFVTAGGGGDIRENFAWGVDVDGYTARHNHWDLRYSVFSDPIGACAKRISFDHCAQYCR
jgi:hypothetical protein